METSPAHMSSAASSLSPPSGGPLLIFAEASSTSIVRWADLAPTAREQLVGKGHERPEPFLVANDLVEATERDH
jgi:hypothetical protein